MGLNEQIVGLNKFLTVIYNEETRLSTILAKVGYDSRQIEILRRDHAEKIINNFISLVRDRMSAAKDGERLFLIINRRFGLDGNPVETLESIGTKLKISRERVRQLEKKAIRRSRHKAYTSLWEKGLGHLASELLEVNIDID